MTSLTMKPHLLKALAANFLVFDTECFQMFLSRLYMHLIGECIMSFYKEAG